MPLQGKFVILLYAATNLSLNMIHLKVIYLFFIFTEMDKQLPSELKMNKRIKFSSCFFFEEMHDF